MKHYPGCYRSPRRATLRASGIRHSARMVAPTAVTPEPVADLLARSAAVTGSGAQPTPCAKRGHTWALKLRYRNRVRMRVWVCDVCGQHQRAEA